MTAASGWELNPEHEEFRASVRAFVDRHDATSQLGGYARLGAVYLTSALPKTASQGA